MSTSDQLPPLAPDTAELYLPLWADGALSPEEAAKIEEYIASDAALADLAGRLADVDRELKSAFAPLAAQPLPSPHARRRSRIPPPAPRPSAGRSSLWRIAAALLAVAGLGASYGAYEFGLDRGRQVAAAGQKKPAGWLAHVADYHRVYASEKRHLVEIGPDEEPHIRKWLSARIGKDVPVPDFTEHGLTFAGARMLVAGGKPVAQYIYTQADGRPVGYCVISSPGPDKALQSRSIGGLNLASWKQDGLAFVVVGWDNPDRLEQIAGSRL
ncbi:MAG: hypothetical protein AAF441_06040 [Pseudomonadota bacterium]